MKVTANLTKHSQFDTDDDSEIAAAILEPTDENMEIFLAPAVRLLAVMYAEADNNLIPNN